MRPVERGEVMDLAAYEAIRDRFRARVVGEKKRRRVDLGPFASCVFENRDTVLMQIQEMLRTERITKESSIEHEIATYNELVPKDGELSATVMIAIDDAEQRDAFLEKALGFERHVAIVVDDEACPAVWDPARELEGRTSAVHYLKFALTPRARAHLKTAKVVVRVDHPAYAAAVALPPETVASLAEDLT